MDMFFPQRVLPGTEMTAWDLHLKEREIRNWPRSLNFPPNIRENPPSSRSSRSPHFFHGNWSIIWADSLQRSNMLKWLSSQRDADQPVEKAQFAPVTCHQSLGHGWVPYDPPVSFISCYHMLGPTHRRSLGDPIIPGSCYKPHMELGSVGLDWWKWKPWHLPLTFK